MAAKPLSRSGYWMGLRSQKFKNSGDEMDEMIRQGLNIIEFIQHPLILNDHSMSLAQIAFLKSAYGLPLTDIELEIYTRGTGREKYLPREERELTLLGGRRGGKTGKLGARIALYEACRDHG